MNIAEKFRQFETSFDLSKFTIDGFWYYPLVKMAVYIQLAGRKGKGRSENSKQSSVLWQISRQFRWGIKWKFKSASLRPVKYLLVDYALTRRQTTNGYFENMYISPIMNALGREDQLLIEYPTHDFGHHAGMNKDRIYFFDWDIFKIFLSARFNRINWIVDKAPLKSLYEWFGLSCDVRFLTDRLNKTFLFINYFRRVLKKIHPQIILLVDGYDYKQMSLIYAAKELHIPTVELQHGTINSSHMAYMYNKVLDDHLFADYLFTFGNYFSELIKRYSVVWKDKRVIPVGFPYIEAVKERPEELPEQLKDLASRYKIIYITSQWTVRDELKNFVLQLSEKLNNEYLIFYKIHPGEMDAEKYYKSFWPKRNIELIVDKTVNSLEIMKVAAIHSTVYSTSYFESVFFALPNIFIKAPKYSRDIEEFVDGKTTFLAHNVDEYLAHVDKINKDSFLTKELDKKKTTFYSLNALNSAVTIIGDILTSTKT